MWGTVGVPATQLLANMSIPKYSSLSNLRNYRAIHGPHIPISFLEAKSWVGASILLSCPPMCGG